MNGRIYDPTLGRFLQADPHIQAPTNTQNYNRYSYVLNNPMSYTDPSGYFFKSIGKFVKKYWKVAAMAAISYYTGQWAAGLKMFAGNAIAAGAASGALTGFITGGIATGSLKGALTGALTGAVFGSIGGHINSGAGWNVGQEMFAHGMAGGVLQVLQGGKFGHGFVSAGIMKGVGKIQTAATLARVTIQAIAGGTISKLTGGKFANGAITSAIQFVVNELSSENSQKSKDELDAVKLFKNAKGLYLKMQQIQNGEMSWDEAIANMSVEEVKIATALAVNSDSEYKGVLSGAGLSLKQNSSSFLIKHAKNELMMFHSRENFFEVAGYVGNIGSAATNMIAEALIKRNVISIMKHSGASEKFLEHAKEF